MDDWGWQELEPWLVARVALPIGPLFCVINGRTRARPLSTSGARAELRRAAARASRATAASGSPRSVCRAWTTPKSLTRSIPGAPRSSR